MAIICLRARAAPNLLRVWRMVLLLCFNSCMAARIAARFLVLLAFLLTVRNGIKDPFLLY